MRHPLETHPLAVQTPLVGLYHHISFAGNGETFAVDFFLVLESIDDLSNFRRGDLGFLSLAGLGRSKISWLSHALLHRCSAHHGEVQVTHLKICGSRPAARPLLVK